MNNHLKTGKKGEAAAADYLKKNGYQIVTKNFRTKFGEIDIVASKNQEVIFVEIKTTASDDLWPEAHFDNWKRIKSERMIEIFLQKNPQIKNYQLDVIAVRLDTVNKKAEVRHYQNQ